MSVAYKELRTGQINWTPARPNGDAERGEWWSVFNDPLLSQLEHKVDIGNQNLKAYEAAYHQASAQVDETRADLFPTLSLTSRESRYHLNSQYGIDSQTKSRPSVVGSGTWRLDLWGQVRRQIESDRAAATASGAELAWLRLEAQADLATDYFELRYDDALEELLSQTVAAYRRSLEITKHQYAFGAANASDVITAQTQMQSAESQLVSVGVDRAKYEHAIALLTGVPPSDLTIPAGSLTTAIPVVPIILPSRLLERRPDVVEAEEHAMQENALIGSAIAAYFPDINLGGIFGYSGSGSLFRSANKLWLMTAGASEVLVDGGARSAKIRAARASYAQSVANYRQQVLTAFQGVEDALSSLRIMAQQADVQNSTIVSSKHAVSLAVDQYQLGAEDYTSVVTAQITALSNEESGLQIQEHRLTESVALIEALGGGWTPVEIKKDE